MTHIQLCALNYAVSCQGQRAVQPHSALAGPQPLVPFGEVVAVNVRIRPPLGGPLYARDQGISEITRERIRPGLILDCYA
jgi:hypothetical protein